MPILCVANWSEGRNEVTLGDMRWALHNGNCTVHFDGSDYDHNRVVTAFSGDAADVRRTLFSLVAVAFDAIDMRKHKGVHPRIGALDVCPFIVLNETEDLEYVLDWTAQIAKSIALKYKLPIFLYEKSETGKHARDLPSLRKGQYEGLMGRTLDPDFGTTNVNPWLGATVMGVRDWLLAVNVNLAESDPTRAREIARRMRELRESDSRFTGVRALGLPLPSKGLSQVSMNMTQPDVTRFDEVYDWIAGEGVEIVETELIGVIRERDLPFSTRLEPKPEQILQA
jgi:glutamate formiminotransferase